MSRPPHPSLIALLLAVLVTGGRAQDGAADPADAPAGSPAAAPGLSIPTGEDETAEGDGAVAAGGSDAPRAAPAADDLERLTVEDLARADWTLEVPAEPVPLGWFELSLSGDLGERDTLLADALPDDVVLGDGANDPLPFGGRRLTLRLGCLRSGPLELDRLLLDQGDRRRLLPVLELTVDTPVPPEQPARVRELVEALPLPMPRQVLAAFYLGGVLVALAAAAYVVLSTRTVVRPVYVPPPDRLALEALTRLRLQLPRTADEVGVFIVAVSDVLRRYIEGRFEVHAPSRTTEEFLIEVVDADGPLAERAAILEEFLTLCDLVKYARHRPEASEAVSLLDRAEAFVEETR